LCYKAAVNCHQWITESRNHRMFGVGRDLCGSSSPILLPKQGHLQQAAQESWITLFGNTGGVHSSTHVKKQQAKTVFWKVSLQITGYCMISV